jgi:hypothetical protein
VQHFHPSKEKARARTNTKNSTSNFQRQTPLVSKLLWILIIFIEMCNKNVVCFQHRRTFLVTDTLKPNDPLWCTYIKHTKRALGLVQTANFPWTKCIRNKIWLRDLLSLDSTHEKFYVWTRSTLSAATLTCYSSTWSTCA